jgi:hypothetical protein
MAETVKKGKRIEGADRAKLAGEITQQVTEDGVIHGGAPDAESSAEAAAPEAPRSEG